MPVHLVRRRYVVFHVLSEYDLSGGEILEAIRESIGILFGELGLSRLHVTPIFFDEKSSKGILRCDHDDVWDLRASMALIGQIGSGKVSISVKAVSGTLNAAKRRFLS